MKEERKDREGKREREREKEREREREKDNLYDLQEGAGMEAHRRKSKR